MDTDREGGKGVSGLKVSRRSYRGLSALPAWLLLDHEGKIVASVRAESAEAARLLFKTGLPLDDVRAGVRVRRAA